MILSQLIASPQITQDPQDPHRNIKSSIQATQDPHSINKEDKIMTRAERIAVKAYADNLKSQGIDAELAQVMAKAYLDAGIIKPVVNGN